MKQNFSLLFVGGILRAAKLNLETELKIQIYTGGNTPGTRSTKKLEKGMERNFFMRDYNYPLTIVWPFKNCHFFVFFKVKKKERSVKKIYFYI